MSVQSSVQPINIHGATVTPGMVEIVSIWPLPLYKETMHQGVTTYRMAAAEHGKVRRYTMNPKRQSMPYAVPDEPESYYEETPAPAGIMGYSSLQVCDTYQWIRLPESEETRPMPIRAGQIPFGLLNGWDKVIGGDVTVGRMGIAVRDERPLAEQLKDLTVAQTEYARAKIAEATGYQMRGHLNAINGVHIAMAKWLGEAGSLPWANAPKQKTLKDCPACGEQINSIALKCNRCSEFLPRFYTDHGMPVNDPAVAAFLAASKKKAS